MEGEARIEEPRLNRAPLLIVWIACAAWIAWLVMMAMHEAGHVLGAVLTGGVVRHVTLHPFALSRTDVSPNPHPLVEISAGPIIGSVVPIVIAALVRRRGRSLAWFIAGFCLTANGAYIGVGAFDPIGDARQMRQHGTPAALMIGFGLVTLASGLFVWHRISRRSDGASPAVSGRDAVGMAVAAVALTVIGAVFGTR